MASPWKTVQDVAGRGLGAGAAPRGDGRGERGDRGDRGEDGTSGAGGNALPGLFGGKGDAISSLCFFFVCL